MIHRLALGFTAVLAASSPSPAVEPGDSFQDCSECPEMVVVPAGTFVMGSPESETERMPREGPTHTVTIQAPFAAGKFEVTFAEWDACKADGGCMSFDPGDDGWGRGDRPVINVSYADALGYVEWLSEKTGKPYRLLSEAEWEYAARAGSEQRYPWGDTPSHDHANFGVETCCRPVKDGADRWMNTAPVGQFPANAFGLHDMQGNVWEWIADCYNETYEGAPSDGTAWRDGDCDAPIYRGGSWLSSPEFLRSAYRIAIDEFEGEFRIQTAGFRVARDL